MDEKKLKAAMVEAGKSVPDMAAACGISVSSWQNKFKGRTDFTVEEANCIMHTLKLTPTRMKEIFFTKERENNSREEGKE